MVQQRAGVREAARALSRMIEPRMNPRVGGYLAARELVFLASVDAGGQPWASVAVGGEGFVEPVSPMELHLGFRPLAGDPVLENVKATGELGLLALDFETRSRARVNGRAQVAPAGGIVLWAREVFGNCPKYIQRRRFVPAKGEGPVTVETSDKLGESDAALIEAADTFFIATWAEEGFADISHRGGKPGFVRVKGNEVSFPDYVGNNLFQSLGNLQLQPRAGLLFIDFESGDTLQLTGSARIDWEGEGAVPGAQRMVHFEVSGLVRARRAFPLRAELVEASRFNP